MKRKLLTTLIAVLSMVWLDAPPTNRIDLTRKPATGIELWEISIIPLEGNSSSKAALRIALNHQVRIFPSLRNVAVTG